MVYPHHGAAVITRKERVQFQGQRTDYFVLEVATDQLILKVPVHTALDRGVRPVISRVVARKVLATFKEPPEEAGANWSRWYKLLTEKINSGDIFQVAEVVRDLDFRPADQGYLAGAEAHALKGEADPCQRASVRSRCDRRRGDAAARQGAPPGGGRRGALRRR